MVKPGNERLKAAICSAAAHPPSSASNKAGARNRWVQIAFGCPATSRQTFSMKPDRVRRGGPSISHSKGDAEQLPYQDGAFDIIVSMIGAMFASHPEVVARELARVCRPAGQIAMANWTPTGFIDDLLRMTGKHVAPPARVPSPLPWGDEATVHERLAGKVTDIRTTRLMAQLKFPFSVADTIEFYRVHYGPTLKAFAALSGDAQAELRRDLECLYMQHNAAAEGTTIIAAEYLEVVATRH